MKCISDERPPPPPITLQCNDLMGSFMFFSLQALKKITFIFCSVLIQISSIFNNSITATLLLHKILTPDFIQRLGGLGKANDVTFLDELTDQCEKSKEQAICSLFFRLLYDLTQGECRHG